MSALLMIDEARLNEKLRTVHTNYVATASNVPSISVPEIERPSIEVYGTYATSSVLGVDTREYLASLRSKIVESGIELKTPGELDREIDEMKGRHPR